MECKNCGEDIDLRTDDNYNADHSRVCCPHCGGVRPALEYERPDDSTFDTPPLPC